MRTVFLIALAAFSIAAPACADRKRAARERLARIDPSLLRKDAARLYKDAFGGRAPDFEEIKSSNWPKSFRDFAPRHVGAYPDGLSLALEKNRHGEEGLYVVPEQMDHRPRSGGRAVFEQIADGIYWYRFSH